MSTKGEFTMMPYTDEEGNAKEKIVSWKASNKEEYNIVVLDHMALGRLERGFNLKQNIDKMSEYIVACRNMFNMTFFIVQQFNQGLSSVDRLKFKGADISPQQTDFKDSTNPYQDKNKNYVINFDNS